MLPGLVGARGCGAGVGYCPEHFVGDDKQVELEVEVEVRAAVSVAQEV